MGLYLVVWGKRKDHKSPSLEGIATKDENANEDILPQQKINDEVIAINMLIETTVDKDKECNKKTHSSFY